MIEMGRFDGWAVYKMNVVPPWRNFKLKRLASGFRKSVSTFGYNGDRFSRSRDYQLLEMYYPEVLGAAQKIIENEE